MIPLENLLNIDRTQYGQRVKNKKCVLELISQLMSSDSGATQQHLIFEAYVNRERLGSTAIGHGIAIPHTRSSAITQPLGALIHLQHGIDFGNTDEQSVDLIFALLVPESAETEHLNTLAQLAKMFSNEACRESLRKTDSDQTLYQTALRHYHDQQFEAA